MATGAMQEVDLLKFLGLYFQTRYVTAEKLSSAKVPQWVLELVPVEICEQNLVLPVRCDKQKSELSFVTTDPSDQRVRQVVQDAAKVKEVQAYLAVRPAIEAAIRRYYKGDIHAFARMDQVLRQNYSEMLNIYEQRLIDFDQEDPLGAPVAQTPQTGSFPVAGPASGAQTPRTGSFPPVGPQPQPGYPSSPSGLGIDGLIESNPGYQGYPPAQQGMPMGMQQGAPMGQPQYGGQTAPYQPVLKPSGDLEALMHQQHRVTSDQAVAARPGEAWPGFRPETFVQLAGVLVNMLESGQGWRQGHSAEVARLATTLGERAGLPPQELLALRLAAYLHDLGKPTEPHLTLLTLEAFAEARSLAKKIHTTPMKLFEAARLPPDVEQILTSLYERADGQGVPGKRAGRDLPVSVRLLSVVDAFCDLVANPRAPGGRCDNQEVAFQRIAEASRRRVFDPEVVGLLRQATGETLRDRIGQRPHVLVIDTDVGSTAVLEQKLMSAGCDVRMVRTTAEAALIVLSEKVDLILSEVRLEPVDGFAFLERLRADTRTQRIPFVFVSEQAEAEEVNRGFELGALDYIVKPYTPEVLVAKIRRVLEQR
jgi:response regulator RpfG family c-di-GMP phosphodiesterase